MSLPSAASSKLSISLLLSGSLIVGWVVTLVAALSAIGADTPGWIVTAAVLVRTQLQTGLFIVAHDAMHRLLWPGRPRRNDAFGVVALALYAGLPFAACRQQHQRHHQLPGSSHDPDFPGDQRAGVLGWYRQFMARYLSLAQTLRLVIAWMALIAFSMAALHRPALDAAQHVLQFATLPLLLSSLQLFVFGTYLPHRVQRFPERRSHPTSLDLPPWLSLLVCFHFGYHREHHDNPALSWYELPRARARNLALTVPGYLQ